MAPGTGDPVFASDVNGNPKRAVRDDAVTACGHIVGLVSDTHGLLRAEALTALQGSDWILHAGDIGDGAILERLREIAPVAAVRGNNDHGTWASRLPQTHRLEVGGVRVFVIHDLAELAIDPVAIGVDVVVCGHSHRPVIERRAGVLFVNPGSAGPRRFQLPISVARLAITGHQVDAEMVMLAAGSGVVPQRSREAPRAMRGRRDRQA